MSVLSILFTVKYMFTRVMRNPISSDWREDLIEI